MGEGVGGGSPQMYSTSNFFELRPHATFYNPRPLCYAGVCMSGVSNYHGPTVFIQQTQIVNRIILTNQEEYIHKFSGFQSNRLPNTKLKLCDGRGGLRAFQKQLSLLFPLNFMMNQTHDGQFCVRSSIDKWSQFFNLARQTDFPRINIISHKFILSGIPIGGIGFLKYLHELIYIKFVEKDNFTFWYKLLPFL